jgi:lipopolysaccharide/colanic/teichoic acid biosynthesis glycosyltransferase
MSKRLFDIVVSVIALILVAPILGAVAVAIKLGSPGPVFFRQARIGLNGRSFQMYKFRTMAVGADRAGPSSTTADDPRVTSVGRVLRRLNLDELPQFVNVLKGDMSVVGPRPQVPWAVERYTPEERVILSVRPGITDWASLWVGDEGERLRDSTDPDRDYLEQIWPEKRRLQLEYIRSRSLAVDVVIVLKTIKSHLIDRLLPKGPRGHTA